MKAKTKKACELHLNRLFKENYSNEDAFELFVYFTNKHRQKPTSERHLRMCIASGQVGTLMRRCDSIAFEVIYNDWSRE